MQHRLFLPCIKNYSFISFISKLFNLTDFFFYKILLNFQSKKQKIIYLPPLLYLDRGYRYLEFNLTLESLSYPISLILKSPYQPTYKIFNILNMYNVGYFVLNRPPSFHYWIDKTKKNSIILNLLKILRKSENKTDHFFIMWCVEFRTKWLKVVDRILNNLEEVL